jgi:hypothetical protein
MRLVALRPLGRIVSKKSSAYLIFLTRILFLCRARAPSCSNRRPGGLFGGIIGYDLQAGDSVVLGAEADLDWSSL